MEKVLFLKCASSPIQIALGDFFNNKLLIKKDLNLDNFLTSRDLSLIIFDLLKDYIKKSKIIIFLLSGPGSYTAVRLQTLIVKTLPCIYPNIVLYHNNTLRILLETNKTNKTNKSKFIKKLSLVYAYGNKYYLAIKNNNSISYFLYEKEHILEKFKDDFYILNGKLRNKNFLNIINKDNINVKIDYKIWVDNSFLIDNIAEFDPFYFDHDEIGVK